MSLFLNKQGYIRLQIPVAPLAAKDTESFDCVAGHLAEGMSWTRGIEGASGVPRNFFRGGGSTNSVDRGQRERGSGGGSPLVKGSGGSCKLVQEISYHIVKFS